MNETVDDFTESVASFLARQEEEPQDWRAAGPTLCNRAFNEDIPATSVAVLANMLRFSPGDGFSDATLAQLFEVDADTLREALLPLYRYGYCARVADDSGDAKTVLEWTPAPKGA